MGCWFGWSDVSPPTPLDADGALSHHFRLLDVDQQRRHGNGYRWWVNTSLPHLCALVTSCSTTPPPQFRLITSDCSVITQNKRTKIGLNRFIGRKWRWVTGGPPGDGAAGQCGTAVSRGTARRFCGEKQTGNAVVPRRPRPPAALCLQRWRCPLETSFAAPVRWPHDR